jgi:hypothetical protein
MKNTNGLQGLIPHLSAEDQAVMMTAVDTVGAAFAARNGGIEVAPDVIAAAAPVIEHIMSGGDYPLNIEAALDVLKNEPTIQNMLIKAEIQAAEMSKINSDIAGMTPRQRLSYARERGLDKSRADTAQSTLTQNEHAVVLAALNPGARMAYARRHGIAG